MQLAKLSVLGIAAIHPDLIRATETMKILGIPCSPKILEHFVNCILANSLPEPRLLDEFSTRVLSHLRLTPENAQEPLRHSPKGSNFPWIVLQPPQKPPTTPCYVEIRPHTDEENRIVIPQSFWFVIRFARLLSWSNSISLLHRLGAEQLPTELAGLEKIPETNSVYQIPGTQICVRLNFPAQSAQPPRAGTEAARLTRPPQQHVTAANPPGRKGELVLV